MRYKDEEEGFKDIVDWPVGVTCDDKGNVNVIRIDWFSKELMGAMDSFHSDSRNRKTFQPILQQVKRYTRNHHHYYRQSSRRALC